MDITEKYRPTRLDDVAGQTTAVAQIRRIIETRGLAGSTWWLAGATGTGKTTIARILAGQFAGNSCQIQEFVGRDVTVDDVRKIEENVNFRPLFGHGRAIIINEAQDLSAPVVALLLATVEKIKLSKYDTIIFTAMIDVENLSNDRATHFRALVTRCYRPELADTDSSVFRQEVVEFVNGAAALEGINAVDVEELCERAGWSIRAALAMLDMQERQTPELESITVDETKMAEIQPAPRKQEKPVSEKKPRLQSAAQRVTVPVQESATGPAEKLAQEITTEFGIAPAVSSSIMELVAGSIMEWVLSNYDVRPKH